MTVFQLLIFGLGLLLVSTLLYLVARNVPAPFNLVFVYLSIFFAIGGCLIWVVPALPIAILVLVIGQISFGKKLHVGGSES
jgi:hypothetical protein